MSAELDEQIAELVFGWKEGIVPPDANKQNGGTPILLPPEGIGDYVYPAIGPLPRAWFTHRWSSDVERSREAIRYVREQPYFFEFLDFLFLKFGLEKANLPKAGHQFVYRFLLATPEEICQAAIEAVKLYRKLEKQ